MTGERLLQLPSERCVHGLDESVCFSGLNHPHHLPSVCRAVCSQWVNVGVIRLDAIGGLARWNETQEGAREYLMCEENASTACATCQSTQYELVKMIKLAACEAAQAFKLQHVCSQPATSDTETYHWP